jgi:hypothetical protein
MLFSENVLSVVSRMRFVLMSSWLGLRVGWTLLKELWKHNKLSLLTKSLEGALNNVCGLIEASKKL